MCSANRGLTALPLTGHHAVRVDWLGALGARGRADMGAVHHVYGPRWTRHDPKGVRSNQSRPLVI